MSVKTVETVDATLSVESRTGGRAMAEKYSKHRKPLSAAKKTGLKEGEGVGVGEGRGWSGDGVGFGMGLGWDASALAVPGSGAALGKGTSSTRNLRDTKLTLLSGLVPGRVEEPGRCDSPVRTGSDEEVDLEGQSDDSDSSCGTVVSLSTSLPIVFSGLQQTPKPSPLATTNTGVGASANAVSPAADDEDNLLVGSEQPIARAMPVATTLGDRGMNSVKKMPQVVGMKGMHTHLYVGHLYFSVPFASDFAYN